MKLLVLTGSPHTYGTTSVLAKAFYDGAREAGHDVLKFDTARLVVRPCLACDYCRKNDGHCVYDDDMEEVYLKLLEADAVAFVTPLYYFGMTAQLKRVIDRFYAVDGILREKPKKAFLIAAGADAEDWAMDGVKAHFTSLCRYLGWEEAGALFALGQATKEDIETTDYPQRAKAMGAGI